MNDGEKRELVSHRYGSTAIEAPVVVLLHGLTEAGTTWPDLVAHWGAAFRILAPDLRGHGESPRFTDDQLPRAAGIMRDDVIALIDREPAPVVLLGHSLGGNLALAAALARPDRVRALILEDPASPPEDGAADPRFVLGIEAFLDGMTEERDRSSEIERMLRDTRWSRAEILAWAECKPRVDRRYIREGPGLVDAPWEESFQALGVPTLLVIPDAASMAPRAEAITNPLVRRVVIEGAGHCVRRDQPAAFHAAVDAFLATLPSARMEPRSL